jgi:type I restriction enzyme, S subunit
MTLPTGWKNGRLGQECSIEIGGTPSRNVSAYWDEDHATTNLWVSIKDMTQQQVNRTAEQITELGIRHSNVKLQQPGTILLSFKLTIGRVAVAAVPLYTNEAIAGLRSEAILHDYLYYGLQQWNLLAGVDQAIKGATLNKEKLRKIEFECPQDPAEQLEIATVLRTVDRAIERTGALIVKQQRTRAGVIQDLLTLGLDDNGVLRSRSVHSFNESEVGLIPSGWTCKPLLHFVPSAEYGISTSLGDAGEPVLRMNNIAEGRMDVSDLKYTDAPVPGRLWLKDGDVLFNRTNSWEHVGRTGIWRNECERATFASYLVRLNPNLNRLMPELLNIWLNWPPIQIAMRRFATPGVQQVNINPTNLRQLPAAFPTSLVEQAEIMKRIDAATGAMDASKRALAKLRLLKTGLMQDLLTGRKRVTALLAAAIETTVQAV